MQVNGIKKQAGISACFLLLFVVRIVLVPFGSGLLLFFLFGFGRFFRLRLFLLLLLHACYGYVGVLFAEHSHEHHDDGEQEHRGEGTGGNQQPDVEFGRCVVLFVVAVVVARVLIGA